MSWNPYLSVSKSVHAWQNPLCGGFTNSKSTSEVLSFLLIIFYFKWKEVWDVKYGL